MAYSMSTTLNFQGAVHFALSSSVTSDVSPGLRPVIQQGGSIPRIARICASVIKEKNEGGSLRAEEYFESFLRRRKAEGDAISRAADMLVRNPAEDLVDEARLEIRQKLQQVKETGTEIEKGYVSFVQRDSAAAIVDTIAPSNPNRQYLERQQAREARRQEGLLEYDALKRELLVMTGGVAAACTAYCFLAVSFETAASYAVGSAASYAYLLLLMKDMDSFSEADVPLVFRRKQSRKKEPPTLQGVLQKGLSGASRSLASPRLAVPAALMALWAVSLHAAGNPPTSFHFELAPLLLGFLAYKAAALIQAYRDNKDLLL